MNEAEYSWVVQYLICDVPYLTIHKKTEPNVDQVRSTAAWLKMDFTIRNKNETQITASSGSCGHTLTR